MAYKRIICVILPGILSTACTQDIPSYSGSSSSSLQSTGPLSLMPKTNTIYSQTGFSYTAIGGVPPYFYAVESGPCSIDSSSGMLSAGTSIGTCQVELFDSTNATTYATVTVNQNPNPISYPSPSPTTSPTPPPPANCLSGSYAATFNGTAGNLVLTVSPGGTFTGTALNHPISGSCSNNVINFTLPAYDDVFTGTYDSVGNMSGTFTYSGRGPYSWSAHP